MTTCAVKRSSWCSVPSGFWPSMLELSDHAGLNGPALTWKLFGAKLAPPSVEKVAHIWASSLGIPSVSPEPPTPRSFRQSYQETATFPVLWSTATDGSNWLLTVMSSFSLAAALHVAPLVSENWNMMSMLSLSFGDSCVHTA